MKKTFNAVALAALVASSMLTTAQAADGMIDFQGEIIDAACEVTPATANQVVKLGQVSAKAFTGPVSQAAATSFQIQLEKCPASATKASVKFDGVPYQGDNTTLNLTQETGVATGVGIVIRDAYGNGMQLYSASTPVTLSTTGMNILGFSAGYIQRGAAVTAGPANATATFSVIYN